MGIFSFTEHHALSGWEGAGPIRFGLFFALPSFLPSFLTLHPRLMRNALGPRLCAVFGVVRVAFSSFRLPKRSCKPFAPLWLAALLFCPPLPLASYPLPPVFVRQGFFLPLHIGLPA